jgi:hypothetical protein
MEAGKRSIRDIFNGMRILEIPYFQRAYVWEEENWDRFLEDMESVSKTGKSYFLGSIILKQKPTGAGSAPGDVRILIDGQQRLTTLFLFLKVLGKARNQEALVRQTFFNMAGQLAISHNHLDSPVFDAIVDDRLTPKLEEDFALNQVLASYRYFEKHEVRVKAIDPMQLFNNVYFVGIDLGAEEDEQQVFNTINSLGVSLSTAELLKNDLFSRKNAEIFEKSWMPSFEADEDTRQYWTSAITSGRERRENIDLFMQAYLLMVVANPDLVRVDALYPSFKEHLKSVSDTKSLIADLTQCAAVYKEHIDPGVQDLQLGKDDFIDRLMVIVFGLSTTTVVPYILYILRNAKGQDRDRLICLVEGYLVRRLLCKGTTKNYNRFFGALIRDQIQTAQALTAKFKSEATTINFYPDDTAIRAGVQNSDLTNKQALVILWLLELSVRNNKKQSTALSGLSHYSLEHLMPKKWRNHWGTLPPEQAANRDQALKKLGNLSLLASGLNTSISDSDWSTKKQGSGPHLGLLEYAKGLETLSADLLLPRWDETSIAAREKRLADQIIKTWPSPF